jgi:hypothetical protein
MASVVSICNGALRRIGASTITALDQGTKNANWCNDRYAEMRDAVMEMHPWNFAVKTAKLAQLAGTPVLKFDFAYQLPADFIRSISVYDSNEGEGVVDHQLRNDTVESSSSEVWMIYVSLVTDPNKMTPLFRETLSAYMAIEGASAIAESTTLRETMLVEFEKLLRRARSVDGMSNLPDRMPVGTWLTGRTGRLTQRRWTW